MSDGILLSGAGGTAEYDPALLHGVKGISFDPGTITTAFQPTSQALYLTKIAPTKAITFSNVHWVQSSAAATVTAGQNFVSIYASSGAGLVVGVGIDAEVLLVNQSITKALGTTVSISAGDFFWVGWQTRATTMPGVVRVLPMGNFPLNAFLTASTARAAINGTGLTAAPASITPASNTTSGILPLVAVS